MALPTMLAIACRLLVGSLILIAGVSKIGRRPARQVRFLTASIGIADSRQIRGLLWCLPALEIVLGLALLLGSRSRVALFCLVILFATFVVIVRRAMKRRVTSGCGCFGGRTSLDHPVGMSHLLFNFILMAAAVYPLVWSDGMDVGMFAIDRHTVVLTVYVGTIWAAIHLLMREADRFWASMTRLHR
jgi:uncharacterized membrane protein YphA (DoxX/SURF4 family)